MVVLLLADAPVNGRHCFKGQVKDVSDDVGLGLITAGLALRWDHADVMKSDQRVVFTQDNRQGRPI